ncbi:MAG: hypothetical protein ACNA8W_01105, partial [Bradymonadaceae bacterium]
LDQHTTGGAALVVLHQRHRVVRAGIEQLDIERGNKRVIGVERLKKLDPYKRPKSPKKSRCEKAVCTDPERVELYKEHCAKVVERYYKARKKARDPNRKTPVKYPPGTSPPGISCSLPYTARDLKALRFNGPSTSEGLDSDLLRDAG